jgi:hypothetical protein
MLGTCQGSPIWPELSICLELAGGPSCVDSKQVLLGICRDWVGKNCVKALTATWQLIGARWRFTMCWEEIRVCLECVRLCL